VTVQAQILDLLRQVTREAGMSVVLITHDLGVVAGMADRVAVMYAGAIVETAATDRLFAAPRHPYTRGLLDSIPALDQGWDEPIPTLAGGVQSAFEVAGCRFSPRCPLASEVCGAVPRLREVAPGHFVSCWNAA